MRIVNLKEFMELENILYTEYKSDDFEFSNFSIKWNNLDWGSVDWGCSEIGPSEIARYSYDDYLEKIELCEESSGVSFPMDFEYIGRYALYPNIDDPIKFAVYEEEDIRNLIEVLTKLLDKKK